MAETEGPQIVPSVEGGIARNGRTRRVGGRRGQYAWAPTMMAATNVGTLRPGNALPTRPPKRTVCSINLSEP